MRVLGVVGCLDFRGSCRVVSLYTPCVPKGALHFFNEISITYQKKKNCMYELRTVWMNFVQAHQVLFKCYPGCSFSSHTIQFCETCSSPLGMILVVTLVLISRLLLLLL